MQGALRSLDIVHSDLARAAVFARVEADLLAFRQTAQSSSLKGGRMNENVLATIVWLDEAVAFLCVVEFNDTGIHRVFLFTGCKKMNSDARQSIHLLDFVEFLGIVERAPSYGRDRPIVRPKIDVPK
jgi:hypothetical protein